MKSNDLALRAAILLIGIIGALITINFKTH